MDQSSVLVHPDAARRQIEADSREKLPAYVPAEGGGDEVGEGRNGGTEGGSPNGSGRVDPPAPPEPTADLSRTFRGVVEIDPMRLGGSAGAISQEVVQRLASIMGSNVRVTLEIQADIPDGIPEKVERDVSENCNTLKFREFDFRE